MAWRGPRAPFSYAADAGRSSCLRPAAFLDRDGVLNEGTPDPESGRLESPLHPEDVRLIPGAVEGAQLLATSGYALVCVSNQPAAAKGKVSVDVLLAIHRRVIDLLGEQGVALDGWQLCPHHPHGAVLDLSGPCACRKPAGGMLLGAARELRIDLSRSWMFGDTDADIGAARAAGARAALISYPGSAHKRTSSVVPDLTAGDLRAAGAAVLALQGREPAP